LHLARWTFADYWCRPAPKLECLVMRYELTDYE